MIRQPDEAMTYTASSFYWSTFISVGLHLVMSIGLFRWLRIGYPEEFERLGSPGFLVNNNYRTMFSMLKFLFTFRYLRLSRAFAVYCVLYTLNMLLAIYLVFAYPVYFRSVTVSS